MATIPPPAKLGAKAKRLWRDVADEYELRADELRVLEDICREVDLIEKLQKELDKPATQLIVRGSMGQPVANPLVQELRQHRSVVARLLAGLKLPDEEAAAERSTSAREAANARWRRGA
jgi:phage terminase small subunit